MGVTVTFNYPAWLARYPEFTTSVSATLAQEFFNEATIYCRNDGTGPASTQAIQCTLLNMLTAHIAALNAGIGGQDASPLVGRINSATEGSVSVQAEMDVPPGSAQWFAQTKYGAAYWQATNAYRRMHYVRGSLQPGGLSPTYLTGIGGGGGRGW